MRRAREQGTSPRFPHLRSGLPDCCAWSRVSTGNETLEEISMVILTRRRLAGLVSRSEPRANAAVDFASAATDLDSNAEQTPCRHRSFATQGLSSHSRSHRLRG